MAVQFNPAFDASAMAVSAMAAGASLSPAAPHAAPPPQDPGDTFQGRLRSEEARAAERAQAASDRESEAATEKQASAQPAAGDDGRATKKTEAGDAAPATDGQAGRQTTAASARAEHAARIQAALPNSLPADAVLDLKGTLVARTAEIRAPVIGLQNEQVALERLAGTPSQRDGATLRPPATPEKEAPVFKPVPAAEKRAEPPAGDAPPREAAEAARRDGRAEVRTEPLPVRSVQDGKALLQPLQAALLEMPLREVRVQSPLAAASSPQLQELRDKVLARIESGMQVLLDRGEGRMTMRLQPPELGRVLIEMQPGDHGMQIKVSTESIAVREVVMAGLEQLKSNLQAAGLEVHTLAVEVNGFRDPFQQNSFAQNDGRRRNGSGGGGGDEPEAAEKTVAVAPLSVYLGRRINLLA